MKENGGRAFPIGETGKYATDMGDYGMFLRDYFAICATDFDVSSYLNEFNNPNTPYYRAVARYAFADAMLERRGI
jgi:hypothetical protein